MNARDEGVEIDLGIDSTPDTMEFALGSADLAEIFVAPEIVEGDATSGTFESIVLEGGLPDEELAAADAELEQIARAAGETVADPGSATMQTEALQLETRPPSRWCHHPT